MLMTFFQCATSRKFAGSIPDEVIEISSLTIIWVYYGSEVVSANNINEYQEYSLGGKGGGRVGLTKLPPSCAACSLEIWESPTPETLEACPAA